MSENPTKGTDPMKRSINISLSEIDNGILVSVGRNEGYGLTTESGGNIVHCPDIDEAMIAASELAKARWESERRHAAAAEEREARAYKRATGEDYPNDLRAYSSKLPEEAATTAEPIPVVDETEAANVMVRDEPVMTTSAFDKSPPTSET